MSENWEFALGFADEGWITYLGDDDGLPLGAIKKVADIIRKTGALSGSVHVSVRLFGQA